METATGWRWPGGERCRHGNMRTATPRCHFCRADALLSELIHLEQAYSNRHSPQYRAAALQAARCVIEEEEAARGGSSEQG
jgi:hypothetical protein